MSLFPLSGEVDTQALLLNLFDELDLLLVHVLSVFKNLSLHLVNILESSLDYVAVSEDSAYSLPAFWAAFELD